MHGLDSVGAAGNANDGIVVEGGADASEGREVGVVDGVEKGLAELVRHQTVPTPLQSRS